MEVLSIMPNSKSDFKEILEYDIYVKMPIEDTHLLGYLAEAEEHLMNIRHSENVENAVKIIVPADLLTEVLNMLEILKEEINLEILYYEPNPGHS